MSTDARAAGVAENMEIEDALAELRSIASDLDRRDVRLGQKFAQAGRAAELARLCLRRLNEFDEQVKILVSDEHGQPILRLFGTENGPAGAASGS